LGNVGSVGGKKDDAGVTFLFGGGIVLPNNCERKHSSTGRIVGRKSDIRGRDLIAGFEVVHRVVDGRLDLSVCGIDGESRGVQHVKCCVNNNRLGDI